jgi:hypothetical protein
MATLISRGYAGRSPCNFFPENAFFRLRPARCMILIGHRKGDKQMAPANKFRNAARIMSNESLREFANRSDYRGQIAREVLTRRDREMTFA